MWEKTEIADIKFNWFFTHVFTTVNLFPELYVYQLNCCHKKAILNQKTM